MKFDQLIEYDMRNIFVEKSCTKYGGTSPRPPFEKKSFIQFFFIVCPSRGLPKHIETMVLTTCFM